MRSTSLSGSLHHGSRRARAPARRTLPVPRRRPNKAPTILRGLAAAILVSGWLAASVAVMAVSTGPEPDAVEYRLVKNRVYAITLADSKRARELVEQTEGGLGLWFEEFDAGLRSLLRPPRLAWTLLLLSTALGVACLELAKLTTEDTDD